MHVLYGSKYLAAMRSQRVTSELYTLPRGKSSPLNPCQMSQFNFIHSSFRGHQSSLIWDTKGTEEKAAHLYGKGHSAHAIHQPACVT